MTNRTKPLIGVTTSARHATFVWWCIALGIRLAGGKATRLTTNTPKDHTICDGYVISGGIDIDPARYGQDNLASFNLEPERDALEEKVIRHAVQHNKPLMGICRGAQMINVTLGGDLHQNARDVFEGFIPSDNILRKIWSRRPIRILHDGILFRLFEHVTNLSVNSLHHQAIDTLGDKLHITAKDHHGLPQAIEGTTDEPFILGVQWHPEFMLYSPYQRKLFRVVVEHALSDT